MWVNRDGTTKKLIPRYSPRIPVSAAAAAAASGPVSTSCIVGNHRGTALNSWNLPCVRLHIYCMFYQNREASQWARPQKSRWVANNWGHKVHSRVFCLQIQNAPISRHNFKTNKQKKSNNIFAAAGSRNVPLWTKESENICCQAARLEKQRVSSSCGAKPRILHANQPQTVLYLPSLHNLVQKKKERIPLMFETPTCAKTLRTFFFFQVPVCFHLTAAWSPEKLLVLKGILI